MKENVIIFGAGKLGKELLGKLGNCGISVICFADNDSQKWGSNLEGIPIIAPYSIQDYYEADTDIVVASNQYAAIRKTLENIGLENYYIHLNGRNYHSVDQPNNEYKRCKRCVMDNRSDGWILFDESGNCNYCNDAHDGIGKIYFPDKKGEVKLEEWIKKSKHMEKGKNTTA